METNKIEYVGPYEVTVEYEDVVTDEEVQAHHWFVKSVLDNVNKDGGMMMPKIMKSIKISRIPT